MSTMQEAFESLGYRPPKPQRPPTMGKVIDELFIPITKRERIRVHRAGGYYRARFEGRTINCFGLTREQAIKNLKFFEQR